MWNSGRRQTIEKEIPYSSKTGPTSDGLCKMERHLICISKGQDKTLFIHADCVGNQAKSTSTTNCFGRACNRLLPIFSFFSRFSSCVWFINEQLLGSLKPDWYPILGSTGSTGRSILITFLLLKSSLKERRC